MIEIKKASMLDAAILAELGKAIFIQTFAKDNRKQDIDMYVEKSFRADLQLDEIRDPKRWIAIAWSGNQAVGFLHLLKGEPDPSVTGAKPIEILRLYVDSQWHGKGVGAALMEKSIEIARQQGFETLWLGVWERNFRAQSFYKKYGYSIVGQHLFRLGMDDQVDFIMARKI